MWVAVWAFGNDTFISSRDPPPFIVSIKVAPHILHLFSEFFAIVMQNTFLPYKSYHYHFQNCHQSFFFASSLILSTYRGYCVSLHASRQSNPASLASPSRIGFRIAYLIPVHALNLLRSIFPPSLVIFSYRTYIRIIF